MYKKPLVRIAVTGGAGQIAYSLLFRIAAGDLLGSDTQVALHILELPEVLPALAGVKMELEDCAFPLLKEIHIGDNPYEVFEGVQIAFLVGAKPRGPGMERKELLGENGKIFAIQGKALNEVAARDIRALVVGNPCNTNCLIAIHNAPKLSPDCFQAMMRLDQNRAVSLLANKAKKPVEAVSRLTIWGNHSSTQVPDYFNALIDGKSVMEVIEDHKWLEEEFMRKVQQRGAEIIKMRGKSSAASAASAAIDAMKAWLFPTVEEELFSAAIYSKGNSYGIDPDLVFSFPCTSQERGKVTIVPSIEWNGSLTEKIIASEKELLEERDLIKAYLS